MPFTHPVWGIVEGVTEPINNVCWRRCGWCRGAGSLRLPALVFNGRLARRGAGFLSGALGLAFLPRDHMDAAILRILVIVDEFDSGCGVVHLFWCWWVPKL